MDHAPPRCRSRRRHLAAALEDERLYRSQRQGFDYRPAANALVLVGLKEILDGAGRRLTVGYAGW